MKKRIEVLDCTLRDGGRCFDNTWGDETIRQISEGLSSAGVDIIEIGFLRYLSYGIIRENSTIFRDIEEMKPFLKDHQRYVAYIEYVLFKKDSYIIPINDGTIEGIRLGILKEEIDESLKTMEEIVQKGYHLYVQGINIMSYSDDELISFVQKVNTVRPHAFAIVDTFGAMYPSDLRRIFSLIDQYLNKDIAIAFHSHNNMQMSLALAITLIEISKERELVIDATLAGIGMGVGNLQTELICKYLNEKENAEYRMISLVRLLDQYIYRMKAKFSWDASLLSYEASRKYTSQLILSYIQNEYQNRSLEEKRKILGLLPVGKGGSIQKIDEAYRVVHTKVQENNKPIAKLKRKFANVGEGEILLVAKGNSILSERERIQTFIDEKNPVILYINHIEDVYRHSAEKGYHWYMSAGKAKKRIEEYGSANVIAFAGVCPDAEYVLNFDDINWGDTYTNDSTLILLMLLNFVGKMNVSIVGMDGDIASELQIARTKAILDQLRKCLDIHFLTDSVYA